MRVSCTLYLSLRPMPRPRVNPRGGTGYPYSYQRHLKVLREQLSQALPALVGCTAPLRVVVVVYKPLHPTSKGYGDADNLAKTVLDALPCDDRIVVSLELHKRKAPTPCLSIFAEEVLL